MTFTDRTMLAALVALAIPVAIHLVGRRRARRMILPTVRFAEAAHQASRAATWLRRAALLALRLAAVALLVLALAGPRVGDTTAPDAHAFASENMAPVQESPSSIKGEGMLPAAAPIRVLVVDAGGDAPGEENAGPNSADLVAATFGGDTNIPKQVTRAKNSEIAVQDPASADVVFWVGVRPQPSSPEKTLLGDFAAAGGRLVFIPGSAPKSGHVTKGLPVVVDAPEGITIDPDGYTSDLLAAFEGGTSGDLTAPVFRRWLDIRDAGSGAIRFHDGEVAIAERRIGRGRVVALAFGPDPSWGDLAGRPEFVVLMHSLAEALAPKLAPKQYLAPGEHTGGTHAEADSREPPPVYSRGANKAGTDLTIWFILALAVVLAAESLLAAVSAPRGSNK